VIAARRRLALSSRTALHALFAPIVLGALGLLAAPIARSGEPGPAAAAKPELTVDRLFGGPPIFGGGPAIASWRPGKDAWVEWRGDGDARALFEVDAASGTATRLVGLVDVAALRGKDEVAVPTRGIGRSGMPDHVFSRDGAVLVLPVGGDLMRVHLADGVKQRMTTTKAPIADPRPSPDGRKFAFSRENDLHVAIVNELTGSEKAGAGAASARETRLTRDGSEDVLNATLDWVYPEELDVTTAIEWSPDSTRIAFLRLEEKDVPRVVLADPVPLYGDVARPRYPKAGDRNPVPRVGVVGLDGAAPAWLDVGGETDVYIPWFLWWPDGSRVLVAVLSRSQTHLELRLCDPSGGPATTWWTEDDARWVDVPPPPRFLRGKPAALVRSRRDGFWRLWRAPLDGSAPTPLTAAGEEIGDLLAVDEDAGLAFVAKEDRRSLRAQVVSVTLEGSPTDAAGSAGSTGTRAKTLTDPGFSHSARFSPTGRFFIDAASLAGVPTKWTLRRADGTEVRALGDAKTKAWDDLALPPPEIRWLAGDPEMPCEIRRPRNFDASRKWPVVFHVYGGPGSRMVSDAFGGGGLFDEVLTEAGIVVVSVDGRGTGGRGKDFEAAVYRRLGTCEVEDLVAAVDRLAKEPWFDRARVGVWGWSYGGTFSALAMGRAPQVFRAGVAVAPVTDWRLYDTIYTERYMDRPCDNEDGYRVAAALSWAKDVTGSLLLAHGLADDNVHAQNTWRMVQALVAAGRPYDLQIYPQRGHGIDGMNERRHLHKRIVEHFREHLVDAPAR
jgi:dipeptidyl-peptidase 4